MNCRALRRFVEATEDSAMTVLILGFSSSRLKALDFFLLPFLSFLSFLLDAGSDRLLKKPEEELLVVLACGEVRICGFGCATLLDGWDSSSSSSSSAASSNGSRSVSRRTFDFSCVTCCFLRGNSYIIILAWHKLLKVWGLPYRDPQHALDQEFSNIHEPRYRIESCTYPSPAGQSSQKYRILLVAPATARL
jgi:hypothetical protein